MPWIVLPLEIDEALLVIETVAVDASGPFSLVSVRVEVEAGGLRDRLIHGDGDVLQPRGLCCRKYAGDMMSERVAIRTNQHRPIRVLLPRLAELRLQCGLIVLPAVDADHAGLVDLDHQRRAP